MDLCIPITFCQLKCRDCGYKTWKRMDTGVNIDGIFFKYIDGFKFPYEEYRVYDGFRFHCRKGSAAESYAKKNGLPCFTSL